jgi:hypothetical protein
MNLDERRKALLKLVAEYREQECRGILDTARQDAAELMRQSFRKERAQLHNRVVAERSRARSLIQAARAERVTQDRWSGERMSLELLEHAEPLLKERLLARWRVPEQRKRWVTYYLHQAREQLPRVRWTVRHAPEWREEERQGIVAELTKHLAQRPRFQREGGIVAGLIVESGGAVLDASLEGLLQDRARVESRLLALVARRNGE